jgi:hypothetical protein
VSEGYDSFRNEEWAFQRSEYDAGRPVARVYRAKFQREDAERDGLLTAMVEASDAMVKSTATVVAALGIEGPIHEPEEVEPEPGPADEWVGMSEGVI